MKTTLPAHFSKAFEPAFNIIRSAILRKLFFTQAGVKLVLFLFVMNGGFFLSVGMFGDWIFDVDPNEWFLCSWAFLLLYGFGLLMTLIKCDRHRAVAFTMYARETLLEKIFLVSHFVFMAGFLESRATLSPTAAKFEAFFPKFLFFEGLWIFAWVSLLLVAAFMPRFKRAFSVSFCFHGCLLRCSEKDMILDLILYHEGLWSTLSEKDKSVLWSALPKWKWELYATALANYDIIMARELSQWMEMETHPVWQIACALEGVDTQARIDLFLQSANASQLKELESYAIPT